MSIVVPVLSSIPQLVKELTKILPNIHFHEVASSAADSDPYLRNSEILVCDFNLIGKELYELPKTKWIQGTWAGTDALWPHIHKSKPSPNFIITRFTGQHIGRLMSEYVVANIVNFERDLFKVRKNQEDSVWCKDGRIENYRAIHDLTVGILGVGSIGKIVGRSLHHFGATINAFGSKPALSPGDDINFISQYFTKSALSSLLSQCDYIINILPGIPETNGLLDGDVLKNCKERKTVFINIGRGNVISEESLVKALTNEWISGAILDVFHTEPLPQNSCLWKFPQVVITPHVSGQSRAKDIAELFRDNFLLYQRNLTLPGIVDLQKWY